MRVLVDGAWGFAGSAVMTNPEVDRVTREAIEIARASGLAAGDPVQLDDTPPQTARYATPVQEDPFAVSIDDKLAILFEADAAMARVPGVTVREGSIEGGRERKTFASSEGARIEQELTEAGAGIEATAVNDSESQVRSWPNSAGGQHVTGGFEAVRAMDLPGNAQRIAEEAVALLDAEECPSGPMTLLIRLVPDGAAGARVVRPSHRARSRARDGGQLRGHLVPHPRQARHPALRQRIVNIDADATAPGGLGTFGFDDEGVPAQNVPIVSGGRFVGYLTSRETARSSAAAAWAAVAHPAGTSSR